jgi:hypothetical protein
VIQAKACISKHAEPKKQTQEHPTKWVQLYKLLGQTKLIHGQRNQNSCFWGVRVRRRITRRRNKLLSGFLGCSLCICQNWWKHILCICVFCCVILYLN